MNKSRWVVFLTLLLTSLTISLALVNLYPGHLQRANALALPDAISYLPKDSNFVLYADLHKFFNSPAYVKFEQKQKPDYFKGLNEFIDKTGIDPRKDLATILVGAQVPGGPGAVLLKGNFDKAKILSVLEEAKKTTATYNYKGLDVVSFQEPSHGKMAALAFLDSGMLAIGDQKRVESYIDVKLGHTSSLYDNKEFMDLIGQASTGDMLWLVGAADSLLSQTPLMSNLKGKAPRVKNVIASVNLDQMISANIKGVCADERSAKDLGDLLRGGLAMARLSVGGNADVMSLLEGVRVDDGPDQVRLSVRIPLDLLDKLSTTPPSSFKF
jgi:hypothetical protein